VLVPAYNEGETVYKTICSAARSDYPAGQLKIIAIDDGSRAK
jgi:hyaluronan synthase